MRIAALIGEPATGKSTLAKLIKSKLGLGEQFKRGLLTGTRHNRDKVIIIGDYSDQSQKFPGTDRLSMACQPEVELFLTQTKSDAPHWSIFLEGDRLGNTSFLAHCQALCQTQVFVLESDHFLKAERHQARGDNQSERFLRSRQTKISNIKKAVPTFSILKNDSLEDLELNAETILDFLLERGALGLV